MKAINLEKRPLSTKGINTKRESLEKKLMDLEKQKPRFFLAVSILALSALAAFIFIMSQYERIVSMEIAIALGLAIGVTLGSGIVLALSDTYFKDDREENSIDRELWTIVIIFFIVIMTLYYVHINMIDANNINVMTAGFLFGAVVGIIGMIATALTRMNKIEVRDELKESIQHEISRFSELDPKINSNEYITLAEKADNDEVVKYYLKQIADLKRKPTLGEYQAILVWAEKKPEREQKLQEEKQAQEVIHKLGFS